MQRAIQGANIWQMNHRVHIRKPLNASDYSSLTGCQYSHVIDNKREYQITGGGYGQLRGIARINGNVILIAMDADHQHDRPEQ